MPTPALPPFDKHPQSPEALLSHLQAKGLEIEDRAVAICALKSIGYYRLLVYTRPHQDDDKRFFPNKTFAQVLDTYDFDRELRLLCMDAIERIEVALRASLNNHVAVDLGAHFYLERDNFANPKAYRSFLSRAASSRGTAARHYYRNYGAPGLPPIWVVTEDLTFGGLSTLYADLKRPIRKKIEDDFGLGERVLVSWFKSLNILRNICAHHNRLWNAKLEVNRPVQAHKFATELTANDTFYSRAVLMKALMDAVAPASEWRHRLINLIAAYPGIPIGAMGFPADWLSRDFWKN